MQSNFHGGKILNSIAPLNFRNNRILQIETHPTRGSDKHHYQHSLDKYETGQYRTVVHGQWWRYDCNAFCTENVKHVVDNTLLNLRHMLEWFVGCLGVGGIKVIEAWYA